MDNQTPVVFLTNNDEIFSFFPTLEYSPGFKTSYARIGQHSACSEKYAREASLASEQDYKDLHSELVRQGYDDLVVINERLDYLRSEVENQRISTAEIAELQSYADFIDKGDTLLLEWAGVEEH